MILIFGLALTGVAVGGLPAFEDEAELTFVLSETFGVDWLDGGDIAEPLPLGKGRLTPSPPEGRGFRAGLAVMLSLEPAGEGSLGALVVSAVLPLGDALGCWPKRTASRLGSPVLRVTIRLFFHGFSPSKLDGCDSVLGRFGAGEPLSSFSTRARLAEGMLGVSPGPVAAAPTPLVPSVPGVASVI